MLDSISTKTTGRLAGLLISFCLALLFTATPFWQLGLLAGFAGGICLNRMRWGALSGFLGVALAWLAYMVAQDAWTLLDQIGGIIIGGKEKGTIIGLVVTVIGSFLGGLGGAIGAGIRRIIKDEPEGDLASTPL